VIYSGTDVVGSLGVDDRFYYITGKIGLHNINDKLSTFVFVTAYDSDAVNIHWHE